MSSTVTDVEQALINARVLEEYWMSNGWESLVLEEDDVVQARILDIYSLVDQIEPELKVQVYIELEDVSAINVNDCLTISKEDLYSDWENRIKSKLGVTASELKQIIDRGVIWDE